MKKQKIKKIQFLLISLSLLIFLSLPIETKANTIETTEGCVSSQDEFDRMSIGHLREQDLCWQNRITNLETEINRLNSSFSGDVLDFWVETLGIDSLENRSTLNKFIRFFTNWNPLEPLAANYFPTTSTTLDIKSLESEIDYANFIRKIIQNKIAIRELENNGASPAEISAAEEQAFTAADQVAKQNLQNNQDRIKFANEIVNKCSFIKPANFGPCVFLGVANITEIIKAVSSWAVRGSNNLFNVAASFAIRDFYIYADLPAVNAAWSIIRDICNLFFIFILLYIAISTILNISGSDVKKLLAKIIMVALFVNFSAILPRVVIDVSNVFALQFYSAMGANNDTSTGAPDITTKLIGGFLVGEKNSKATGGLNYTSVIIANLGQSILFLITAFVLLAGAGMFIYRSIVLLLLIITSPFYFLGLAVPYLSQHTKKWLDLLISQSLYAPVLMFLMLITITFVTGKNGFNEIILNSTNKSEFLTIIYFAIVNTMMIGSFIVASKMGAGGAGLATKYGNKAKDWGIGLVKSGAVGAGGFALTRTVGRMSNELANSETMRRLETYSPRLGGTARRAVGYGGKTKFGFAATGYDDAMKKKQDFRAERFKTFKTSEEKAAFMSNLNDKEGKKVYESLTPRERVQIEEEALPRHRDMIQIMRSKLTAEEREKTDKAQMEKEKQNKEKTLRDKAKENVRIVVEETIKIEKKDSSGNTMYYKKPDGTDDIDRPIYETGTDGKFKTNSASKLEIVAALEKIPASQIKDISDKLDFDPANPAALATSRMILENISKPQFIELMKEVKDWSRQQIAGIKTAIQEMESNRVLYPVNPNEDVTKYANAAPATKALLGL